MEDFSVADENRCSFTCRLMKKVKQCLFEEGLISLFEETLSSPPYHIGGMKTLSLGVFRKLLHLFVEELGLPPKPRPVSLGKVFTDNKLSKTTPLEEAEPFYGCAVGAKGNRSLVATRSCSRGNIVCRDSPLLIHPSLGCNCSHSKWTTSLSPLSSKSSKLPPSLALLPEHVEMAWSVSFAFCTGRLNESIYDQLLTHINDHITLSPDLQSWEPAKDGGDWSLFQVIYFLSLSSLISLYSFEVGEIKGESITKFCSVMFCVLLRLPTNVHSISTLVPTNCVETRSTILQQERKALALFMVASACNHSCRPNVVSRYIYEGDGYYSIELVCQNELSIGQEIVMSCKLSFF